MKYSALCMLMYIPPIPFPLAVGSAFLPGTPFPVVAVLLPPGTTFLGGALPATVLARKAYAEYTWDQSMVQTTATKVMYPSMLFWLLYVSGDLLYRVLVSKGKL